MNTELPLLGPFGPLDNELQLIDEIKNNVKQIEADLSSVLSKYDQIRYNKYFSNKNQLYKFITDDDINPCTLLFRIGTKAYLAKAYLEYRCGNITKNKERVIQQLGELHNYIMGIYRSSSEIYLETVKKFQALFKTLDDKSISSKTIQGETNTIMAKLKVDVHHLTDDFNRIISDINDIRQTLLE